jgi:hypothetical protein
MSLPLSYLSLAGLISDVSCLVHMMKHVHCICTVGWVDFKLFLILTLKWQKLKKCSNWATYLLNYSKIFFVFIYLFSRPFKKLFDKIDFKFV